MFTYVRAIAATCLMLGLLAAVHAAVEPGKPAPDFTLPGIDGKSVTLSQFRGKYVVLEWFNSQCPFVQKHYESSNMQSLQSKYIGKGVVWLVINSTNPDHSNYRDVQRTRQIMSQWHTDPSAFLFDLEGDVGQMYGARTTPHMYIIDPRGSLVYKGGIDDKPSFSQRDIPGAKNYVAVALDELMAGKPVSQSDTRPYGCSIKYRY